MSQLAVPQAEISAAQGLCRKYMDTWFGAVNLDATKRSRTLSSRYEDNTLAENLGSYRRVFSGSLMVTEIQGRTTYLKLTEDAVFKAAVSAIDRSLADWKPGLQEALHSPSRPIIRARIKNARELFGIKPLLAQADARGADLLVEAWFGEPDWEITDDQNPSEKAETVRAAINMCWISVDWPSGQIEGDDRRWVNTKGVEHKLDRQGLSGEPFWKVESAVSGEPVRGLFESEYLCRLLGPDRGDVTVSLQLKAAGMKLRFDGQEDLDGIERLRVFERLLVNTIQEGFDQNSEITVFSGPPKSLSDT